MFFFDKHIFLTEVDSDSNKAVHDEIAKNLVQFLRRNSSERIKLLFEVSIVAVT